MKPSPFLFSSVDPTSTYILHCGLRRCHRYESSIATRIRTNIEAYILHTLTFTSLPPQPLSPFSTHQHDLDVARWSTVARRVQIDVQSHGHFRQMNVVDHRLTRARIDRRVVRVVDISLWIVHT